MTREATEVKVDQTYYKGNLSRVFYLDSSIGPREASDLLAADQLVSSVDGLSVATIQPDDHSRSEVAHNLEGVPHMIFKSGVRILEVRKEQLLVWGTPVGSIDCGVYEIGRRGMKRIQSVTTITRIHRSHHGFVLFGQCPPNNDDIALTSFGTHEADGVVSAITTKDNRYLFFEKLERTYFRYYVGKDGFEEWAPIDLEPEEKPIAILRLHCQPVLLSRGTKGCRFRSLGSEPCRFDLNKNWSGCVEHFSVSPDEESLALIVRPSKAQPNYREIYLNGECIFQGEFLAEEGNFVWAEHGSMCGLFITSLPSDGGRIPMVVTPTVQLQFPSDKMLREFLVDDTGRVAATIVDNGDFCTPTVYDRIHTAVPLAWNLHFSQDGSVGYNSIQLSCVLHTSDETEMA